MISKISDDDLVEENFFKKSNYRKIKKKTNLRNSFGYESKKFQK